MGLVPLIIVLSALAAPDSARKTEGPGVWLAALPATLSQETEVDWTEVHGCRISIGTAVEAPPFPPLHHVWLKKEGCGNGGYVLLGTSYSNPSVLLDGRKQGLVAAFTFRETPSGSAYGKATLVSVDFVTGDLTHSVTLAALPPFGTGMVEPTSLELKGNGTLILRGTKNGVIPGESGDGDEFVATFDRFLRNEQFNPVPTSVIAF